MYAALEPGCVQRRAGAHVNGDDSLIDIDRRIDSTLPLLKINIKLRYDLLAGTCFFPERPDTDPCALCNPFFFFFFFDLGGKIIKPGAGSPVTSTSALGSGTV